MSNKILCLVLVIDFVIEFKSYFNYNYYLTFCMAEVTKLILLLHAYAS